MPRWARRALIIVATIAAVALGSLGITAGLAALGALTPSVGMVFGGLLGPVIIFFFAISWDRWGE